MTDNFLWALEEKVAALLAELDQLRFEVKQLEQDNAQLKAEKWQYTQKTRDIISLLETAMDRVDAVGA